MSVTGLLTQAFVIGTAFGALMAAYFYFAFSKTEEIEDEVIQVPEVKLTFKEINHAYDWKKDFRHGLFKSK